MQSKVPENQVTNTVLCAIDIEHRKQTKKDESVFSQCKIHTKFNPREVEHDSCLLDEAKPNMKINNIRFVPQFGHGDFVV